MARIIGRVNRVWLYSKLDERTVRAAHLNPTKNPQKIIDQWIRDDSQERILIFKDANKLAIYNAHLTKKEAEDSKSLFPTVAPANQSDGNRL